MYEFVGELSELASAYMFCLTVVCMFLFLNMGMGECRVVMVNMAIGHASIRIYQRHRKREDDEATASDLGSVTLRDGDTPLISTAKSALVYGLPLSWYRTTHAVCMALSFSMLFGAGVMFTRRSRHLRHCTNMFAPDDSVVPGAVFYERGNDLWIGGTGFVPPLP